MGAHLLVVRRRLPQLTNERKQLTEPDLLRGSRCEDGLGEKGELGGARETRNLFEEPQAQRLAGAAEHLCGGCESTQ